MNRSLVVVSNRLPFRAVRDGRRVSWTQSPGGLVTALAPVVRSSGGIWVGWSGLPREDLADRDPLALPRDNGVRYVDVPLTARDVSLYYHAFSNRTLWPLLHCFIGRTDIDAATWRAEAAIPSADDLGAQFEEYLRQTRDD